MTREEAKDLAYAMCDDISANYDIAEIPGMEYERIVSLIDKIYNNLPHWISVEDRLPDNSRGVLVYVQKRITIASYYRDDDHWYSDDDDYETEDIYYWSPLPQPPKED